MHLHIEQAHIRKICSAVLAHHGPMLRKLSLADDLALVSNTTADKPIPESSSSIVSRATPGRATELEPKLNLFARLV